MRLLRSVRKPVLSSHEGLPPIVWEGTIDMSQSFPLCFVASTCVALTMSLHSKGRHEYRQMTFYHSDPRVRVKSYLIIMMIRVERKYLLLHE